MGAFPPVRSTRPLLRRRAARDAAREKLTVIGGLASLSLDAMAPVSYGPEAIVLVLARSGRNLTVAAPGGRLDCG